MAEAYDWYERRRTGLGEEFFGCIEAAVETLVRKPLMYPKVHKYFRRVLVRRCFVEALRCRSLDGV